MIKRNLKYNHVYDNMLKFLTNLIPKKQLKKIYHHHVHDGDNHQCKG